jgi:DNA-binding CsgD family transcriptional regulator
MDLAGLLGDLYGGALDDDVWDRAMIALADCLRASAALLYAINPTTLTVLRDENHRFDPCAMEHYRRYWIHQDCRLPAFNHMPVGSPMTERHTSILGWEDSSFLNEFLRPVDAPHFMPVWLNKSDTKAVALSFQGTRKRGPFDPADLELLRKLAPHIGRALKIRDRLEQAHIRLATPLAALEAAKFGALVLDAHGRVLERNPIAAGVLREDKQSIHCKADGSLWLIEPAGRQYVHWIATGVPPKSSADGLIKVPRKNKSPLSILISALPEQLRSWIRDDPRWLLLVFDPDMALAADVPLLAKDLEISPREAEIASLLFSGETPASIARRFGVSQHTVRAQIKSIFKKTGLNSQSSLVRRVALGPAVRASASK